MWWYCALQLAQADIFWQKEIIGQSEHHRDIVVEQFGQGGHTIAIFASIHGTETIGTPLLFRFSQELLSNPKYTEGQTILLCYMVNPDGTVADLRGNRNNIDLNRNFPTENFGRGWFNGDDPMSAIETEVIYHFVHDYDPDRLLVIHQPLNGIDFDGQYSEDLAEHLSEVSGIRIKRLGSRSGSLGSYAGKTLEKQIITLEIPEYAENKGAEWLWLKYEVFLDAFVLYPFQDNAQTP